MKKIPAVIEFVIFVYNAKDVAEQVHRGNCIAQALDSYTFQVEHAMNNPLNYSGVTFYKNTLVNGVLSGSEVFAKWEPEYYTGSLHNNPVEYHPNKLWSTHDA